MKGVLRDDGLWIERNGKSAQQWCPLAPAPRTVGSPTARTCNGWCPLFHEPFFPADPASQKILKLCHTTLFFDEFTDEREED